MKAPGTCNLKAVTHGLYYTSTHVVLNYSLHTNRNTQKWKVVDINKCPKNSITGGDPGMGSGLTDQMRPPVVLEPFLDNQVEWELEQEWYCPQ